MFLRNFSSFVVSVSRMIKFDVYWREFILKKVKIIINNKNIVIFMCLQKAEFFNPNFNTNL